MSTLPDNVLTALRAISDETTWDNWESEPEDGSDQETKYWKVSQVLFCKLDHLAEELSSIANGEESDEHMDTIEQVQKLLTALAESEPNEL